MTILSAGNLYAQKKYKNGNGWGGFHVTSFRGNLFFWGDYRFQKNQLKTGFQEEQKSGAFSGEINLYSKSYLLHPNFLLIDFDLGYAPGTQRDNFLVAPDRTDTRTAEKVLLGLTFFNNRPVTLSLSGNYNHSFVNRELTSDVETWQYNFISNLYLRTFIPISLSYSFNNWRQDELQTLRDFALLRNTFTARIEKDFAEWNENEFVASYDDYYRQYENDVIIANQIASAQLKNRFFFDESKKNRFQSFIWYYDQQGSQILNRLQINENLYLKPFDGLGFDAQYRYNKLSNPLTVSNQHYAFTELSHQLYASLRTFVNYEFTDFKQTFFNERKNWFAAGFSYRKKIPTGTFRLGYTYRIRKEDKLSKAATQTIIDEEKVLNDDEVVLLDNPFVNLETVVVTDLTGTIVYQEGLDYLLIPRGEFLEIKRIPGGQIPQGGTVYVDYTFEFKADYNFNATGNNFNAGITVFNNFLDLYFMYNNYNYDKLEGVGFNVLKVFNQRIYGARINIAFISAGFEYDDYNSNITPYRSLNYFLTVSETFFNRLLVSVTGNYRDYLLLPVEKQIYKDATGRFTYLFSPFSKLNLSVNTRIQRGSGIDLDLTAVRAEFETRIRDITLKFGYENFNRLYIGETVNYNNIYLRVGRYF